MEITRSYFGTTAGGEQVDQFFIANSQGVSFRLITYGATISSVKIPDAHGKINEICIGFDTLSGYEGEHPYFGATIGRFANRIAGGSFRIGERTYQVDTNENGRHHIHGGETGFNRRVWEAFPVKRPDEAGVTLNLHSPHLDGGYPGNLDVKLEVMLNEKNELSFTYDAATDRPTPVNLTNHAYWNLGGQCSGSIGGHIMHLNSETYLEVDDELIPTGNIVPVKGTGFDFLDPRPIGEGLEKTGGIDHCYTLSGENALSIPAAQVFEPESRRSMTVFTISPGLQFYTGNFLDHVTTRCGEINSQEAFCLETEEYPDAVNRPGFPDAVLEPGDRYFRKTILQFGIQ